MLAVSLVHSNPGTVQTFLTGGGCAAIPGIGSPILMIANAHKYIEDALNIKNAYTSVRYIFFLKTPDPNTAQINNYKLMFSITDYNGTKYIAVDLNQSPFGIGSTKINKFMMTADPNRLKQFFNPNVDIKNTLSCGDLKFVYSSFGNDPTADLDYPFPGRNQNTTGLAILDQLRSNGSTVPGGSSNPGRTCSTAHYSSTNNFFGTQTGTTPREIINCCPNEDAIATMRIGCGANSWNAVQLGFNNCNDNGITDSVYIGNPNTQSNTFTTFSLGNAEKITFQSFTGPASIIITTYDANNNQLQTLTCGNGNGNPQTRTILVEDFLGFSKIYSNGNNIQGLDLTEYIP